MPRPGGGGRAELRGSFRSHLQTTMSGAAGPYGYTISLGGSTALATNQLGPPHLVSALALMAGAVAGFVLLEAAAQRSFMPAVAQREAPPSVWGNAHIPSAGAAICVVWGVVHLVTGAGAWALVGFAATSTYFAVTALQRIAIDVLSRRRRS